MVNTLKGKSVEQRKDIITNEFKALGQKKFDIQISPQAKAVIANCGENFPLEKLKTWYLQKFMSINGNHVFEYLATQFEKDME